MDNVWASGVYIIPHYMLAAFALRAKKNTGMSAKLFA